MCTTNVQMLNDPADAASGYSTLDPGQNYQVATSNFQGLFAGGYKDIFANATYTETGLDVWDEVRKYIQANSPVMAQLDNRIVVGPATDEAPATLPASGTAQTAPWLVLSLGLILIVLGLVTRWGIVTR